jgi:hypothetical protein
MEHETYKISNGSGKQFLAVANVAISNMCSDKYGEMLNIKFSVPGIDIISKTLRIGDKISVSSLDSIWEAVYNEKSDYGEAIITVLRIHNP